MRLLLPLALVFPLWALDVSMLTPEKQEALKQLAASIDAGEKRLKYDWVGDFSLSASATESKSTGSSETLQSTQAGVGFSQDLFRSGGITASIRYAGAWARAQRLTLEQEENGYLSQLAQALMQYRQDKIRLEQNELNLKNSEITLFLKQRQYEAGEADITQLNDALMNRNTLQKTRLSLKNTLSARRLSIAALTPLDPETIPLPEYSAIEKSGYLAAHLETLLAKAQTQSAREQYAITRSGYLPTLSFNADYGYRENEGVAADGDSYSATLQLSMPLSFTASSAVEEKKTAALRSASQETTAALSAQAAYDQAAGVIASTQESIKVLEENIRLYDQLISVTDRGVQAGQTSRYDLQTLQNTRAADAHEIRLAQLDIALERAKLYYAMTHKETHE